MVSAASVVGEEGRDVGGQPGLLWLLLETANRFGGRVFGTVIGDRRDASYCWSEGGPWFWILLLFQFLN